MWDIRRIVWGGPGCQGILMKAIAPAALLVIAGLSMSTQAAEPTGTLTLACEGTMTDMTKTDVKPEPISMGIVFNFSARTVAGFASSLADLSPRVEIKAV